MPTTPSISFAQDGAGRIVARSVDLGRGPETTRYAYDSAGRLAHVTDGGGALRESYQYDREARRLADINPLRFRGERRYTYSLGDRLLQSGDAQYAHDPAGFRSLKVAEGRQTQYHYEPSGLLLAVELPDGRRVEYGYDADGLRREKRIDGRPAEAFRWLDPLRLLEFHDGERWWRLAYTQGRTPVGVTDGRESYLLLADQLGTPLALATPDGNVVQTMRYDSFGNPLRGLQGPVRLPLGFAGGLFDADTGLTRFVWRDYDADTGRFTALDPLGEKGGDSDWCGSCLAVPINRADAWGLEDSIYDWGGEGRSLLDGPKHGNFCGKNWTGGWNPALHGGRPGPLASVDSADEKCRIHDFCYDECANQETPDSCKKVCDAQLVKNLQELPEDSSRWERRPPPGKEDQAETMRKGALWWFQ